jgi:hypothetical protein
MSEEHGSKWANPAVMRRVCQERCTHPDGRQLHDMADSREEKVYRSQGWGGRRVMIAEARHAQQDEVW